MGLLDYHWKKIGWKRFEEMCMYLAECVWRERRFALYGREGEEQDGIDILSKNEKGDTVVCIQCKHYETMDFPTLKKIIRKFEEEAFVKTADCFVIATRAALNSRELTRFIELEKERLKENYDIIFETWDGPYIEKELSNHYTLTSNYFGIEIANMVWSGKSEMPLTYPPVPDFIERSLISLRDDDIHMHWLLGGRKLMEPVDLFTNELSKAKRYCLLADAYEGKTTLLEQLAHDLLSHPLKLKAVLLRLKEQPHRALVEILDSSHRWWRSVPLKELVIIIDGLDEVDAGRFLETVKHINELSHQFPSLAIVFSCRKLFFHHNEVQKTAKGFSYYEIYPLQQPQVDRYLTRLLQNQEKAFRRHITAYDLEHFLYHPFYLRSLVRIFKTDRRHLPKSRAATIQYFIEETFASQDFRELKSGFILKRKEKQYLLLLKKAAFAMQLRGQNILLDSEVQQLFPTDEDIELLRVGTVLTFSHDKWSFQNAIFQEYLSALVLERFDFAQIGELVCIGREIKKVKTKWIQTLVSLFSILRPNDPRKAQLLQLLRNDNIELVTLCDSQLLSPEDRLEIWQQLLHRYERKGLRPMAVHEDAIGRFFRNTTAALEDMLSTLHPDRSMHLKRIVWRILQFVDLPASYHERVLALAVHEIGKNQDSEYVRDILYTVSHYGMATRSFVEFLITQEALNGYLRYRDSVYDIILQLELGETFYDYGLQGIVVMFKTPADNFMRSEHALEQMLLSAASFESIVKLFHHIASEEWVNFRRSTYSGDDKFMVRLATLCSQLHDQEPLILFAVLRFVRALGYKHLRDDMKEIDQFFVQTGTASIAIRYFIHLPSEHLYWELGELLTEPSFDFLFDYYERGYLELGLLQILVNSYHDGDKATSARLYELYLAATGAENFRQRVQEQQTEREAYEAKKRQNDALYIQSQAYFTEGLKKFFDAHGKDSLEGDEIFVDYAETRRTRNDVDANVISSFIVHQIQNKKPVTLSHCLRAVAKQEYFDYFRMHELLHYPLLDKSEGAPLRQLLKQLYDERIVKANFVSAVKQEGGTIHISNWELLLSQVFSKYEFATDPWILMDMLCMDLEGISNFRNDHFITDHKRSLSEIILEHLTPEQQQQAADVVLQRLQNGIDVEAVMENHLALCRRLGIYEARDIIFSLLLKKRIQSYHVFIAAEIFVELGGEWSELLPVLEAFDQFDAHAYYQLVLKLKDEHPDVVVASLLRAIRDGSVSMERRMNCSQILMELGRMEGFYFFAECLRNDTLVSSGPPRRFNVQKLETHAMLEDLSGLIPALARSSTVSLLKEAKSILVDLLFAIGEKSEEDLLLVDALLKKGSESDTDLKPEKISINWYRERLLENFRDKGDSLIPLSKVGTVLAEIN